MRYLSVCSGIEAASAAWHSLGWTPLAFSEIEPFPRAVLAHHFPGVPLHGDFTVLRDQPWIVDADLLVGGTPCQAFSVAGLRGSLADARGNLSLEFVRLANAIDDLRRAAGRAPAWIVWENVPGVLSVSDNAFGAFLGGLVGSDAAIEPPRGRGWTDAGVVHGPRRCAAWRVLDAQHFGVAQRRRRVFVLARGGAGGWSAADALLPVIDSMSWHPAPRRAAGQRPAPSLAARTRGGGGLGTDAELDGALIAAIDGELSPCGDVMGSVTTGAAHHNRAPMIASTGPVAHCLDAGGMGRQDYETETLIAHSLRAMGHGASHANGGGQVAVAFDTTQITSAKNRTKAEPGLPASTIAARSRMHVAAAMQVRRLTPRECERLQGFPDDWTLIPWRGKPAAECPDGPRHKALGNSMAVPCMRWLGERIAKVSS